MQFFIKVTPVEVSNHGPEGSSSKVVYNHWTGMVEWNRVKLKVSARIFP